MTDQMAGPLPPPPATWCPRCGSGDHDGHDPGNSGRCRYDNQFNADCRCPFGWARSGLPEGPRMTVVMRSAEDLARELYEEHARACRWPDYRTHWPNLTLPLREPWVVMGRLVRDWLEAAGGEHACQHGTTCVPAPLERA